MRIVELPILSGRLGLRIEFSRLVVPWLLVVTFGLLNGCATSSTLQEGTNAAIDSGVHMAEQTRKMADMFMLPFRVGQGVSNFLRIFGGSSSTNSVLAAPDSPASAESTLK